MGQPMPPPYPGQPYYAPMSVEGMLKKRFVLALNAIALLAIWLAVIIALASNDLNALGFARFLAVTGGVVGAFMSLAGALGSKRTTDMQSLGLFIWAGFLITVAVTVLAWVG